MMEVNKQRLLLQFELNHSSTWLIFVFTVANGNTYDAVFLPDGRGSGGPITALAVRVELTRCKIFCEVRVRLCKATHRLRIAYAVATA